MATDKTSRPDAAQGSAAPPSALVKALSSLLRPLVRALVAHGITLPFLSGMLKRVYVEVVNEDFAIADKQQTASRISLMSGVHRKDVRRLLDEPVDQQKVPKGVSVGARLIGIWAGSPDYVDEAGRPLPLPRSTKADAGISFDSLVETINRKDIRPRAVLDELVRLGVARVDENDVVHLVAEAFLPSQGFDELAYYFGRNLRDQHRCRRTQPR